MQCEGPLVDRFGRVHDNLRLSVTDRCNLRCFYCMPEEAVQFRQRSEILQFEEIERFVRISVALGVRRLRITGGEPLVRAGLPALVRQLAAIPGVADLAMTTNGLLLAEHAAPLRAAGLQRLNISLDSLRETTFRRIARRDGLARVLAGIDAAVQAGFDKIRLNTVAIRGITESEVIALAEYALAHAMELRFIEFMPLDAGDTWERRTVVGQDEIVATIGAVWALEPVPARGAAPADRWRYTDTGQTVGVIPTVTKPFCGDWDRVRLTADGQFRTCLFATDEFDLRAAVRSGESDAQIAARIEAAVATKWAGHQINTVTFRKPNRSMSQIGG